MMCFRWIGMPKETNNITETINYVFTGVFICEATIKLFAFQLRYFKDTWNKFDFFIISASLSFLLIQESKLISEDMSFNTTTQVLRTFRIGRMFKLFSKLKQLQIIFTTFINTLSSILNVGALMMLLIYIYSVIGVNVFAQVKWSWPMHERLNFMNTPNALLTLIRVATGEGWNDLMNALGKPKSYLHDCEPVFSWKDYKEAGEPLACGDYKITYAYFGSYLVLITLIFLNLFIAIILNGYFDTRDQEGQVLNAELMAKFKDAWA